MSLDNAQEQPRIVARLAPVDKFMAFRHFCGTAESIGILWASSSEQGEVLGVVCELQNLLSPMWYVAEVKIKTEG